MKMYVAVVDRVDGTPSRRSDHTNAAFVGENRDHVIRRALEARNKWGAETYRVLVGELTGEVCEPVQYEVVPLPLA